MSPMTKQRKRAKATLLQATVLSLLALAPVLGAQPNLRIEGYAAGEGTAPPTCGTSGYALPGQQVELLIKLYNDDLTNAVTGISGTLTLLNQETINGQPLIRWSNAIDTWPDLAVLLADCNQAGFAFQIHREIPCHHRLNFRLTLATDQGATNLLFSIPIGELSSCPHVDLPDHRLTSDPGNSNAPAIALGPNLYGVVWKDTPGVTGLYFAAYDRFFAQVVGPRLIQAGSLLQPDLIYNPRTDRFLCTFEQSGWIQIASFDRTGENLSIQVTSDTGSNPRVTWNPSGRIGVLYADGSGAKAFVERDDVYPFGNPTYAPSTPSPALGSHDAAYDPRRDQYFIAYEKFDSVGNKYDVYYTTYSTTSGYSPTCPPDTCRIVYAKEPAVVVRGDEYALAWEQDSAYGQCSAQVHEIHLRLMDFALAQIHPNYDDMVVSDPTDLHSAQDPLLAWSESADRYILHWVEDTCQTNQDGMNLDAIWQRTLNRNTPVGTVSFDPPCQVEDGLLYQSSDSRLRGRFDRERSFMTWGDHRVDPRGSNYEIFANHAFNAQPHAFVPEGNATSLLLPNEAGDDVFSASDGDLFWISFSEQVSNSSHLLFSLYDQSLAVQNGKEAPQNKVYSTLCARMV